MPSNGQICWSNVISGWNHPGSVALPGACPAFPGSLPALRLNPCLRVWSWEILSHLLPKTWQLFPSLPSFRICPGLFVWLHLRKVGKCFCPWSQIWHIPSRMKPCPSGIASVNGGAVLEQSWYIETKQCHLVYLSHFWSVWQMWWEWEMGWEE